MRAPFHVALGGISAALCLALSVSAGACAHAAKKGASQQAAKPVAEENKPRSTAPLAAKSKALISISPDGTRIAYQMQGTGPALMLVHGPGQTRTSWGEHDYVDRLSKRFTVITVDQRGSGESDKPTTAEAYTLDHVLGDLLAVADSAAAKRFHVWGYGQGATIVRYLAARSDRVTSAVLVGAIMGPPVSGILKDAMVAMRAKWQPLLEAKRAGTLDLKGLSPGDRATLDGGTPVSALVLGALVDYPPLEPAEIKAPTLWLVGSADASLMENVKEYESKLAGTNVTLKVLSGASYSESFGKIDDVMAAVEPFLAAAMGSN